jgi:hypothetical protein
MLHAKEINRVVEWVGISQAKPSSDQPTPQAGRRCLSIWLRNGRTIRPSQHENSCTQKHEGGT